MITELYIVKSDGDPLYGRSFKDDNAVDLNSLPLFVKNSVTLFHSRSSTSSERVYTLEHDGVLWAYVFSHSFILVALFENNDNLFEMKHVLLAISRGLSQKYGDLITSWNGSMAEIVDLDNLVDEYLAVNLGPPSKRLKKAIVKEVHKALLNSEIAFAGVFDTKGKMIEGNFPETHLFRIEVEISQGVIKPVMDIVPTSVNSGDYKLQMLGVNSLTVVVASQIAESTLRAIAVAGEMAQTLYELE